MKTHLCKGCYKRVNNTSTKFNGARLCFTCISKLKKITEKLYELNGG